MDDDFVLDLFFGPLLLADRETKGHFGRVPAFDLFIQLPADLRAAQIRPDLQSVVVRFQLQRPVRFPGKNPALVVVLHDDVLHVRFIKRVPVDAFPDLVASAAVKRVFLVERRGVSFHNLPAVVRFPDFDLTEIDFPVFPFLHFCRHVLSLLIPRCRLPARFR